MKRRGLIPFILLNILLTALVAYGIISLFSSDEASEPQERLVTFEVIVTATPDPLVTPNVMVVTATPDPSQPERVEIPESARDGEVEPPPTSELDADNTQPDGEAEEQSAEAEEQTNGLPEGCIEHVIADGEFPSLIAERYEVDVFTLLAVNGLDEERSTLLQIGDVLIVPLEGCPVEDFVQQTVEDDDTGESEDDESPAATSEPTLSAAQQLGRTNPDGQPITTPESTIQPTPTPTRTLAPTAENAQVEIVQVIGAGDITLEAVEIRNNGALIDVGGWTLSDGDGNSFVFPGTQRLFSGGGVTVHTQRGENSPIAYYWGRDEAVYQPGDVITLTDRDGNIQASLRLPETP